jgi:hypothetical protein
MLLENLWSIDRNLKMTGALFVLFLLGTSDNFGQANLVGNASFDSTCTGPYPPYWHGLDSSKCCETQVMSTCNGGVPINGFTYQLPRTGQGYFHTTFFCNGCLRCYLVGRLKRPLNQGATYCARYFVNISNNSSFGIDGLGIYFGTNQFDTIRCNKTLVLSFLSAQILNPNIITDTLNWTAIQGTFVANGDEKYIVLGNFKSDSMTNTISLNNPLNLPGTDVCLDDVSCFPIDLAANAGPNKGCLPGDSVFIGRTPDVGLNEHCTWFQLPNMSTPIATVAGLYVKPVVTTTYVVRQQLWCSGVRWDTVVVFKDQVGIEKLKEIEKEMKVFPNPGDELLEIVLLQSAGEMKIVSFSINNVIGEKCLGANFTGEDQFKMSIKDLSPGVYIVNCKVSNGYEMRKTISVQR